MTTKLNDLKESIEIDLTDEEFCHIAKMAHERDITFNQMVEHILSEEIKRIKGAENE